MKKKSKQKKYLNSTLHSNKQLQHPMAISYQNANFMSSDASNMIYSNMNNQQTQYLQY